MSVSLQPTAGSPQRFLVYGPLQSGDALPASYQLADCYLTASCPRPAAG
jgi:hypothetical protein